MANYDYEIQEFFDALDLITKNKKKKAMEDFEKQLTEETNALILEAVKHFSKRFRKGDENDFDERYFYNKTELNRFLELNKNPQVKIREEYDENNPTEIYCYIAYR